MQSISSHCYLERKIKACASSLYKRIVSLEAVKHPQTSSTSVNTTRITTTTTLLKRRIIFRSVLCTAFPFSGTRVCLQLIPRWEIWYIKSVARCVLCFKYPALSKQGPHGWDIAMIRRPKYSSWLWHILDDIDKLLGAKIRTNQASFPRKVGLRSPTSIKGSTKEIQDDFYTTTFSNYF